MFIMCPNCRETGQKPEDFDFRSIFQSSAAGIAVLSPQAYIIQANPALCQLLGYTCVELSQLNIRDITHPEDIDPTHHFYEEMLSGNRKVLDYEKRYLRKDGSIFWGHATVNLVYDQTHNPLYFVATVHDITSRKLAEEELRIAHRQMQDIIEFLPDATFVIDRSKNVVAWNRALEAMSGVRKEEIIGKGDYAYAAALYNETKPILIDLIDSNNPEREAQYLFIEKDGDTLFAERFMPTLYGGKGAHVALKASPLRDPEGNLVGAIESIRDITDHKLAEEELRAAHRQMQDIIEFLPDATFVVDQNRKVVAWNRAMESMSGVRKEEIIGKGEFAYALPFYGKRRPILIDLISSPDLENQVKYDFMGHRGETKFIEQYLPILNGGKGAYVWATASLLRDQEGKPAGAIESIRDITDRKLAEDKLKQANRELDAFVYTISHDMRSPLTPIIGFAQHLSQAYKDRLDPQALDCLSEIQIHGQKMVALLEDLLILAKVGHVQQTKVPTNTEEVVQEILAARGLPWPGCEEMILLTPLPELFVPKTLLSQIFDNLISNALRYGGWERGPIEVGGIRNEDLVNLYVRDHGKGIPAAERARIFDVFYRGTNGREHKGTGVGLAIVQKIARLYGGNAWVEETPGGGSTFRVELLDPALPLEAAEVALESE